MGLQSHSEEELSWRREVLEGHGPSALLQPCRALALTRENCDEGKRWRKPARGCEVEVEVLWEPLPPRIYPSSGSRVHIHLTGRLAESGAVFDASRSKGRGAPLTFKVGSGEVLAGLERGVLQTCLGGASRVRVAGSAAYVNGVPGTIEAGAALIFDVVVEAIDDSVSDIEDATAATRPVGAPAELLSEPWPVSAETRSFAHFRRSVDVMDEVAVIEFLGATHCPVRAPTDETWTGSNEASSAGLCVVDAISEEAEQLRACWTWEKLCTLNRTLGLAKYKAPIRRNVDTLRSAPVVEVVLADFAEYCLRLERDDPRMNSEPRFYLSGLEPFIRDDLWGDQRIDSYPQLDRFPHCEDLTVDLFTEYETQVNVRLFGQARKDDDRTRFKRIAEDAALDASKRLTKAFIAPTAATTRLHRDNHGAHARLTLLHGQKLYVAFHPDDEKYLYVDELGHSPVDILRPDLEAFPLYARAKPYAAILTARQTILIPCNWFHAAVSLTPSVTIMRNFWNRTNFQHFLSMQNANFQQKIREFYSA